MLIYPGEMEPNPSIRLKLLREGLEDMEYLILLGRNINDIQDKLGAKHFRDIASLRVREICRGLIDDDALRAHARHNVFLLPHFIRDAGHIERVREELADEIIMMVRRPYALLLTDPEEKQYTDSSDVRIFGIVEPGSVVEINGGNVPVDKKGNFSARLPLESGSNMFSIHVKRGKFSKLMRREIIKF
jgi:hypothetical protein